jgi:hypothetical protein
VLLESIIPRVTLAGNPGEGAQSLDKPARAPHRWEFLHEFRSPTLQQELLAVFRAVLRSGSTFIGGLIIEDFEREFARH